MLLGLWGIGLVIVLVTPLAFPDWPWASFFSTSQVEEAKPVDLLQLYIPVKAFFSLAKAVVPAVVVFSVLIGLAPNSFDNKEALLKRSGRRSPVGTALTLDSVRQGPTSRLVGFARFLPRSPRTCWTATSRMRVSQETAPDTVRG
jgi:hypothetical protein